MNGWVMGWIIGAAVVLVVAVLLLLMIRGAAKAAGRAEAITAALEDAASATNGLWKVADTSATAARIVSGASAARHGVEGSGA